MLEEDSRPEKGAAEELLRRALLDESSSVAVSLQGRGAAAERGGHGHLPRPPGSRNAADIRGLRQPRRPGRPWRRARCCGFRATSTWPTPTIGPRPSGCTSSRRPRCATRWSAPTSCSTCGASRSASCSVATSPSTTRSSCRCGCPAHRLLPTALVAPESQLVVTPVCSARTLAEGKPPMGIACAQQDVTRIYPLADDPERCVEDFLEVAAEHARALAERLDHQEASVERFLELSE